MLLRTSPSRLTGTIDIPASKSHTIRGLLMATLADGQSTLYHPLRSADTLNCVDACRALGAQITMDSDDEWHVTGTAGRPTAAADTIDIGNSGTTLYLAMGIAALAAGQTRFTGDEQIQRRSATPLLQALRELGATVTAEGPGGCAPLTVGGGLHGGLLTIECPISQYLSSLLIACPLARGDTTLIVPELNEAPYVALTLSWLDALGIHYTTRADLSEFIIPGRQHYPRFKRRVPGDFSSATFFLVAAAITGSRLTLSGLDMHDPQGDKAVVGMMKKMGCTVTTDSEGLTIQGPKRLRGATFDLNATPDALPAMAVAGCFAEGETRLVNVPQARMKETDRIDVMATELGALGAAVQELPDGLIIRGTGLNGGQASGYGDHRIVMAMAVAGLAARAPISVTTAESASITFPRFPEFLAGVGAHVERLP
jgi:3-phosphoshikimate 1-carboxyvinyltransferase